MGTPEDVATEKYFTPPEDKEAQEKIENIITTAECFGRHSADIVWKEGREEATKDYISQILQALHELGYRKLPEGKPPLLSDEDCIIAWGSGSIKYEFRVGTEVRRKLLLADIAGIEREFTIIINDEKGIKMVK